MGHRQLRGDILVLVEVGDGSKVSRDGPLSSAFFLGGLKQAGHMPQ